MMRDNGIAPPVCRAGGCFDIFSPAGTNSGAARCQNESPRSPSGHSRVATRPGGVLSRLFLPGRVAARLLPPPSGHRLWQGLPTLPLADRATTGPRADAQWASFRKPLLSNDLGDHDWISEKRYAAHLSA